MNILFATNSYLYATVGGEWNVERQFEQLALEGGHTITPVYSRLGGGTVQDHWEDDFRVTARGELATGAYDLFVINGSSATDGGFETYLSLFVDYAAGFSTETLLLGTWPGDWQISLSDPDSQIDMEEAIYRAAAIANEIGYVPVPPAYRELYLALADLYSDTRDGELVEDLLTADRGHGTHLGNYLAATMLYATIFGEAPPDTWRPTGVSAADAALVRQIAWAVTQSDGIPIDGTPPPPPANADPVLTIAAAITVAESETAVATATATDADGDPLTFAITGGADAGLFGIDATTGAISFLSPPDYEAPADQGGNNVYNLRVAVSDGQGGSDNQLVAVTVTDVPENGAPPAADDAGAAGTEDSPIAGTLTGSDPEGGTLIFTLAAGPTHGEVSVQPNGAYLYTPADDFFGSDSFDFLVEDPDGNSDTGTISLTVAPLPDDPVLSAPAAFDVLEDTTAVATIAASDPDGDTLSFAITGGADAALFGINATTGALRFLSPPDFENPTDQGGNNVYDVVFEVSDGTGRIASQALAVTVTDGPEGPQPGTFSGRFFDDQNGNDLEDPGEPGIGGQAVLLYRGTTQVDSTVTAADGSYAFTGLGTGWYSAVFVPPAGAEFVAYNAGNDDSIDSDVRQITAEGGQTVRVRLDGTNFAANMDAGVTGTVSPGPNTDPVLTGPAAFDVPEDTTAVATVAANDAEGDPLSYAIAGGTDAALFGINATTGALAFLSPPDFENPADQGGNNVYDVTVAVSDGRGGSNSLALAVTVTDGPEAPPPPPGPPPGSISGRFFSDLNGNGIDDADDAPVAGQTVLIYRGATQVGSTVTEDDGSYLFTNLEAGWYAAVFVPPAGAGFVDRDQGNDDTIDSDVRTVTAEGGQTKRQYLDDGGTIADLDAGLDGWLLT
ncbi:hypothetical protein HKCCE3408_17165 [Rhodobacterales bacterium HKCCE3408]|nr:hypothetical protein [Rhodobacterales bacterium HKCCE3408]